MKKIGLVGAADATTVMGDVTVEAAVGLETVSGKSFDPLPQSEVAGSCAVGAGSLLVLGDHVTGTGGVDGYVGWEGEEGGVGAGVGVGVVVVVVVLETALHPRSERLSEINRNIP